MGQNNTVNLKKNNYLKYKYILKNLSKSKYNQKPKTLTKILQLHKN